MALQSSGAISLSQIQSEFGGSNPIGINEYYRGGSYVKTTRSREVYITESQYASPIQEDGPYTYAWVVQYVSPGSHDNQYNIYWADSAIVIGAWGTDAGDVTSFYASGYTYTRQGLAASYTMDGFFKYLYNIKRGYYHTVTDNINTSIPSSGTISFNQFYGTGN